MRDPAEDNVWPQRRRGAPDTHDQECPRYRWTRTDVNCQCVTLVAARDSERKRIAQEVRDMGFGTASSHYWTVAREIADRIEGRS